MKLLTFLTTSRLFLIFIVILASIVAYATIFQNQFVIDDQEFIVNWDFSHSLKNIPAFFAGETTPNGHEGVYRPMRAVFYALAHQVFGDSPLGYHIFSLLILISTAVLIFQIIELLTKSRIAAFVGSLVFALHPLNTEAITYVTANFDMVGVVFFFAAFYCYLLSTMGPAASSSPPVLPGLNRMRAVGASPSRHPLPLSQNLIIFQVLSLVFSLVAFFTNELTLTLPILILLYEWCFGRSKIIRQLTDCTLIFLLASFYLFIRMVLLHIWTRGEYLGGSFYLTMLTMVKALFHYLSLTLVPIGLSINQLVAPGIRSWIHPLTKMDTILSQSIYDVDVLGPLLVIGLTIFTGFKLRKKYPIILFGILWYFIAFLPVSYLIPQGPIMQERYAFISLFGYSLIIGYICLVIRRSRNTLPAGRQGFGMTVAGCCICLILLIYGLLTYNRNTTWRNNTTVWKTLAASAPDDVIANFITANEYVRQGNSKEAIRYYNLVLKLEPRMPEIYASLGKIYQQQGDFPLARDYYNRALAIYPDFSPAKDGLESLASTPSGTPRSNLAQYVLSHKLIFSYPPSLQAVEIPQGVRLTDSKKTYALEVLFKRKSDTDTFETRLTQDKKQAGKLIREGQITLPKVDGAYQRVWQRESTTVEEIFIQKANAFITLTIRPADALLSDRNRIIESMIVIE